MSVIRLHLRAGSGSRAILPQVRLAPWDFETDVESCPCHHGQETALDSQDLVETLALSACVGVCRSRGQRTIGPSP